MEADEWILITLSILHRRNAEKQRMTISHRFGNCSHHGITLPLTSSSSSSFSFDNNDDDDRAITSLLRASGKFTESGAESATSYGSDFTSARVFPTIRSRRASDLPGKGKRERALLQSEREKRKETVLEWEQDKMLFLLVQVLVVLLLMRLWERSGARGRR